MKEEAKKKRKKGIRWKLTAGAGMLLAVLALGGGLMAKYVKENRQQAEMTAAQFHISSDYLEETEKKAKYSITDWKNGFDILLYNYEKENIAQISECEISYEVEATNGWTVTDDGDGKLTVDPNKKEVALHLTPGASAKKDDKVTVTVTTTVPYTKTLSAEFILATSSVPDYTLQDQGDGIVLLTIHSNDFTGDMTIQWTSDKLDPDNTNPLMSIWMENGTTSSGNLSVKANHTYELLFFEEAGTVTGSSGTGTEITLN